MAQPDSYFVIVHVLEGHFGILPPSLKQAGNKKVGIYVECSLKGALQQTEPVNSSSPVWNHRFMYQLTPKTLLQFKTDRVPLKLQFQLQDLHGKSPLGHVVLNLRDGETNEKEKTHSLLHAKEQPPPQVTVLFRICKKSEWEEEQREREKREHHLRELKKKMGQRSPTDQILAVASTKLATVKPKVERPKTQRIEPKPLPQIDIKSLNSSFNDEDFELESRSSKPIASKTKTSPIKASFSQAQKLQALIEREEREEEEERLVQAASLKLPSQPQSKPPPVEKEKEKDKEKEKEKKEEKEVPKKKPSKEEKSSESSSSSESSESEEEYSESDFESEDSHKKKSKKKSRDKNKSKSKSKEAARTATPAPPTIETPAPETAPKQEIIPKKEVTVKYVSEEELDRLWRVSVELRCVRDFVFPVENLYFQYSYPIFGSDDPVYTQPIAVAATLEALEIEEESPEFPVRNSFCTFQFPFKAKALYSYLESAPLVIDAMDKTRNTYDKRIGF